MKRTTLLYWIFTGLFAAAMLFSSWSNVLSSPEAVDLFRMLQLPAYLLPFLGWAKVLGVLVMLAPGLPSRMKEWAYAGLFFDLIGATYCIMMTTPGMGWLGMLMFFVPGVLSYWFYLQREKALAAIRPAAHREAVAA